MMKRILLWAMPACTFIATSCRKVVDVAIQTSDKQYVIEGKLDNTGTCKVLVSLSENVSDVTAFNGVDSAIVTVAEAGGSAVTLKRVSQGNYQNTLKGQPGKTYHLSVTIKGTEYTADCTMPQQVAMGDLTSAYENAEGGSRYVVSVGYNDPKGVENYYNFVQTVNRKKSGVVFINEDYLTDGTAVSFPLLYEGNLINSYSSDLKKGDTVQVEMQCISADIYKYWYSLQAGASGESLVATPANPVTNINGGALGYFSAHTSQSKKIIVK